MSQALQLTKSAETSLQGEQGSSYYSQNKMPSLRLAEPIKCAWNDTTARKKKDKIIQALRCVIPFLHLYTAWMFILLWQLPQYLKKRMNNTTAHEDSVNMQAECPHVSSLLSTTAMHGTWQVLISQRKPEVRTQGSPLITYH